MTWKATTDAIMARVPSATVSFGPLRSTRLTVLAYHRIEDPTGFARQLDHVRRHMRPVALGEVIEVGQGAPTPSRAVLVTFDDGDRSVLEVALPLLAERELPAVAFVVPGVLDSDRPFWWVEVDALVRAGDGQGRGPDETIRWMKSLPDEQRAAELDRLRTRAPVDVRQRQLQRTDLISLQAGGVEIGNHTLTHRYLSRCSDDAVTFEIAEAHRILEEALGHAPRAFAYPDRDRDPRALPILRELGYRAAFFFDHRLDRFPPPDPLAISRVRVSSSISLDRFRAIVTGVHPRLHALRSRITGREA